MICPYCNSVIAQNEKEYGHYIKCHVCNWWVKS